MNTGPTLMWLISTQDVCIILLYYTLMLLHTNKLEKVIHKSKGKLYRDELCFIYYISEC